MINCQELRYDPILQKERIERVTPVFGKMVVQRLFCFTLYLLGVNRRLLAETLSMSPGSVRTIIRSLQNSGLPALEDRRRRTSQFLPVETKSKKRLNFTVDRHDHEIIITKEDLVIKVPTGNLLQTKVLLLTLLNNGLLDSQTVARTIGISSQQVYNLSRSLQSDDVTALIDKRQGQKMDYKVTPEVKSELIQQFAANVVTRGQTSGRAISEELKKRCNLIVPERTVRYHVVNLGLNRINKTLPKLVTSIKKTL